jgi:hypothetical protein
MKSDVDLFANSADHRRLEIHTICHVSSREYCSSIAVVLIYVSVLENPSRHDWPQVHYLIFLATHVQLSFPFCYLDSKYDEILISNTPTQQLRKPFETSRIDSSNPIAARESSP